jgi:HPt (histidine-containing phosphotransfer) domain-containing protein
VDYEIDSRALARVLRMGGPGLLGRLVETALGNLETRRCELAAAVAVGDAAAAERAAHSLKSSSRNLGATTLGNLAETAEHLAAEGHGGWPAAAHELLGADLAELRRSLERATAAATAS